VHANWNRLLLAFLTLIADADGEILDVGCCRNSN